MCNLVGLNNILCFKGNYYLLGTVKRFDGGFDTDIFPVSKDLTQIDFSMEVISIHSESREEANKVHIEQLIKPSIEVPWRLDPIYVQAIDLQGLPIKYI